MDDKEFELGKDMQEFLKQLGEILKKDRDFCIKADKRGVLLTGNLTDILFGLGGICDSIQKTATEKFNIPKKDIQNMILKSVRFGLKEDITTRKKED